MKFLLLLLFIISLNASAGCLDKASGGIDLLGLVLEKTCPHDVREFKELLNQDGLFVSAAMVSNRGFHNPDQGSFSIFETASGDSHILGKKVSPEHLYFGHFTTLNDNEIILDQENDNGKLLIEVMAWDFKKEMYNFYELRGSNAGPKWFYRGDSQDALLDNQSLKIGDRPQFGERMRCSGCHSSGGPIMKELTAPHNDWWTASRGLPFGKNSPSEEISQYLKEFVDASSFAASVKKGMDLLQKEDLPVKTLKEKLRPLFCATEINLYSDMGSDKELIGVPSLLFVDPLLVQDKKLPLSRSFYEASLKKFRSMFPETDLMDADHAFLAPGRSAVDTQKVKALVSQRLIDEEFVADVLSIDFKNPLFSTERCGLLKLIPETSQWKDEFKVKLKQRGTKSSLELLEKLGMNNKDHHQLMARNYLVEKIGSWKFQGNVDLEILTLNKLRLSVFKDEISRNPKGQILEPGFRVIFPVLK